MDQRPFHEALDCENRGETEKATELYRSIDSLDRDYVAAQLNLGRLSHVAGSLDEAERIYRGALDLEPNHAIGRFNLGVVLEDRGAKWDAITEYRRSVQLNPHLGDARYNLARLYQQAATKHWFAFRGLKLKGMV